MISLTAPGTTVASGLTATAVRLRAFNVLLHTLKATPRAGNAASSSAYGLPFCVQRVLQHEVDAAGVANYGHLGRGLDGKVIGDKAQDGRRVFCCIELE
jgi:hypothetical protein